MAINTDHDVDETAPTPPTALELRRPDVPADLNELAAQKDQALDIIDARAKVLATLRKAAIGATSPEDWLLFRSPVEQGGQVTAYLQDCGADRVRDLYGIEIFNVSRPERLATNDPNVFHYLIRGDGRCKLTRQTVVDIEGGRSSTDDFCRGKTGVDLELAVRKAARANLDGSITRELAGLKSVPIDELKEVWAGTRKKVENCRLGRGFGTRDERLGGGERPDQDVQPPPCGVCGKPMELRKGSKGFFYSCADYKQHGRDARTVDLEEWKKHPASKKSPAPAQPLDGRAHAGNGENAASGPATAPRAGRQAPTKVTPPSADEIFGGHHEREPGEEG
jgi:hypothetical protein